MGWASSGFEIGNTLDRRAYPTARRQRTGPIPGPATGGGAGPAELPGPPQSRLLAFTIDVNTGLRTTACSTKCYGPALLLELHAMNSVTNIGNFSLEVGIANSFIQEADVALTTPKGWRPITERVSRTVVAENANRVGFKSVSHNLGVPESFGKLNYVVLDPEFFVTFSVVSEAGAGSAIFGHLALLQRLTVDQLAVLLG